MVDLTGKLAVIIGGTSGIGFATAQRMSDAGARIFITGRRQAALDDARRSLRGDIQTWVGDIATISELDGLLEAIREKGDDIDILVVNAASIEPEVIGSITEAAVDRQLAVNVKGAIFAVQKALPAMRDGGSIVMISSIAAHKGMPAHSVYGATKAAVRSLARGWAIDLKDRRIRVNVVTPGPTDTPGLGTFIPDKAARQAFDAHLSSASPSGRIGEAEEVAAVVSFLASDDAAYVNGAELRVDGGFSEA